jgi:hypothetical protein
LDKSESRQPIQLQPDVKEEFDKVHGELRTTLHDPEMTQSACVHHLIETYRNGSQRQQV